MADRDDHDRVGGDRQSASAQGPQLRIGALVFGLAFLVLGVMGMAGVEGTRGAWMWLVLLGAGGVATLISAIEVLVRRSRRDRQLP